MRPLFERNQFIKTNIYRPPGSLHFEKYFVISDLENIKFSSSFDKWTFSSGIVDELFRIDIFLGTIPKLLS